MTVSDGAGEASVRLLGTFGLDSLAFNATLGLGTMTGRASTMFGSFNSVVIRRFGGTMG
jgi:hypothetical protein